MHGVFDPPHGIVGAEEGIEVRRLTLVGWNMSSFVWFQAEYVTPFLRPHGHIKNMDALKLTLNTIKIDRISGDGVKPIGIFWYKRNIDDLLTIKLREWGQSGFVGWISFNINM